MKVRPWLLVSAAWIVPAVLATLKEVALRRVTGDAPASAAELLFAGGDWLIYALLTPGVFALAARWPLRSPYLGRRIVLHLSFSLVFCALWAGSGTLLRTALLPHARDGHPAGYFVAWLLITLPFGVAVYFCVLGIEHAIRYFTAATQLNAQLATARFDALQAQLNPHFLFNTLNTIAVLVRDGERTQAARIVEQLSDVLRRTLSRHRANEVTLGEELELVRQYLAIEQARFSDRLRPRIDVDDALLSAAIPGFALQTLVENAIRHGIAQRSDAGEVVVEARRDGEMLVIVVSDDGIGIGKETPKGHGIDNTQQRLRTLYGERASLTVVPRPGGGTMATLRIPYREMTFG